MTEKSGHLFGKNLYTTGIISFFPVVLFLLLFSSPYLFSQGWQDYADLIRQESRQEKLRDENSSIPEPIFSLSDDNEAFNSDGNNLNVVDDFQSDIAPGRFSLLRPIPDSSDPSLISDASLFGLCCSGAGKIWVVGDRGAVWMSDDNGEKWFLVRVPTTANLKAVSFADNDNGLIVGGKLIPGTKNGHGVILRTKDGGQHWSLVDTNGIPFLYDVYYSENGIAEAWGDSSELYPSGYFLSEDGGQTWDTPLKTVRHDGWGKGISGNENFSGLSRSGKPYRIDEPRCEEIELFHGDHHLTDFALSDSNVLFSGSQGGLFLWDGGSILQPIPLPSGSEYYNFNTVSLNGRRIDLAGDPGTKIFTSTDAGRSWSSHETGITLPIRKIFFTDPQNGVAVGDLGNILVTHDGGANWSVKHEGGRRVAWLGLFETPELIPFHWVTSLSLKDGYLGAADLLTPSEEIWGEEVFPKDRLRESFVSAGGSSFLFEENFAVPPQELNLPIGAATASWNNRTNEAPEVALKRHIVQTIRTWRPTLLVLSEKNDPPAFLVPTIRSLISSESKGQNNIRPSGGYSTDHVDPIKLAMMVEQNWNESSETLPMSGVLSPMSKMIRDIILESVYEAADPQRFPEQIDKLGLPPWKVCRIGVVTGRSSSLSVKTGDYISSLGQSVDELALLAQNIAFPQKTPSSFLGFEFVSLDGIEPPVISAEATSPFYGLEIPRGNEIRRQLPVRPISEKETLPIIRERRRLLALADHLTASSTGRADTFRGNIDSELRSVDPETAAEVLLRLGKNLSQAGDPDSAAEYWERLISEFPETIPAREGAVRLLRSYAGLERVRRVAVGRAAMNRTAAISQKEVTTETDRPLPSIVDHSEDAVRVGAIIRDCYPELYMTPEVRFPLAAAQRRGGELQNAIGYYYNRSNLLTANDFTARHAAGEYALLNDKPEKKDNPLSIGSCYPARSVPFLDGILEAEVWNDAETFQLTGTAGFPQTFVSLLSDDDHLFIGIVAHQSVPTEYEMGQRVRDTDLSDFDRVEIALDPDRDFIDSYRLTFDCRGWICDTCQNDKNWNPQVYIARKVTDFGWILEIAIPWRELCDAPPNVGNVWGIALRRIIPGSGYSSWNWNGKNSLKDNFGYLRFY